MEESRSPVSTVIIYNNVLPSDINYYVRIDIYIYIRIFIYIYIYIHVYMYIERHLMYYVFEMFSDLKIKTLKMPLGTFSDYYSYLLKYSYIIQR